MIVEAVGNHLVEDQQCTEFSGYPVQHRSIFFADRYQSAGKWGGIDQYGGESVAGVPEKSFRGGCIVERYDDGVGQHGGWRTNGIRRCVRDITPIVRRGVEADLRVVVHPVISPFDFGDTGPSGPGPGGFDRQHHGFGATVAEPDLVDSRNPFCDQLCHLDLAFCGHGETAAVINSLMNSRQNFRMGVAMNQRGEVIHEVDPGHTVDIHQRGPVA